MMWEEPRPERIPGRNEAPAVNLVRLLITVALISGVTLVLSNKLWPGFSRAPGNELPPPASEALPARPPAPRPMEQPRRMDPAPAAPRPHGTVSRGDPGVLRTLSETCRYWTEQNTRGQYSANQQMACDDMNRYAREFGMGTPVISGRGPAPSAQRATAQPASPIYVNQCEALGQTTIDYRQCRAAEQDRLNNWCHSLRTQLDGASGARRDMLRRDAQAVCGEASRYQIVR
jgi:hypothetical protein